MAPTYFFLSFLPPPSPPSPPSTNSGSSLNPATKGMSAGHTEAPAVTGAHLHPLQSSRAELEQQHPVSRRMHTSSPGPVLQLLRSFPAPLGFGTSHSQSQRGAEICLSKNPWAGISRVFTCCPKLQPSLPSISYRKKEERCSQTQFAPVTCLEKNQWDCSGGTPPIPQVTAEVPVAVVAVVFMIDHCPVRHALIVQANRMLVAAMVWMRKYFVASVACEWWCFIKTGFPGSWKFSSYVHLLLGTIGPIQSLWECSFLLKPHPQQCTLLLVQVSGRLASSGGEGLEASWVAGWERGCGRKIPCWHPGKLHLIPPVLSLCCLSAPGESEAVAICGSGVCPGSH